MSLAEQSAAGLGRTVAARALRVSEKAEDISALRFTVETREIRRERPDQVLVEIRSAGVNPSDAKAALGLMPHAVWPRTPGRDFAGIVIEGPNGLPGREVWGSGGELGIRRDGTHATHVVLDAASVRPKPATVPLLEAGGVGVPFITALEGFHRAGMPRANETVLVLGLNGKVGQAAAQIATAAGAHVIGVVRRAEPYAGHASAPVDVIDASSTDVAARVRALTGGKGADIVYNTVGSPYFEAAHKSLAVLGRQILIATIDKTVPFNIFEFYRGRHTYVGVDTLALDSRTCAAYLDALAPGFESGKLKAFPVEGGVYGFADAKRAYAQVLESTRPRVVIVPDA